jgi:hypothetical protein
MVDGKDLERSCLGLIEVIYWHLPERTEENHENLLIEIRTEHFPNTRLDHYHYTSLFGH